MVCVYPDVVAPCGVIGLDAVHWYCVVRPGVVPHRALHIFPERHGAGHLARQPRPTLLLPVHALVGEGPQSARSPCHAGTAVSFTALVCFDRVCYAT